MGNIYENEIPISKEPKTPIIIDVDLSSNESTIQYFQQIRQQLVKKEQIIVNIVGQTQNNKKNNWKDFVNYCLTKNDLLFYIRGTIHLSLHYDLLTLPNLEIDNNISIIWDNNSNKKIINALKKDQLKLKEFLEYYANNLSDYKEKIIPLTDINFLLIKNN